MCRFDCGGTILARCTFEASYVRVEVLRNQPVAHMPTSHDIWYLGTADLFLNLFGQQRPSFSEASARRPGNSSVLIFWNPMFTILA